MAEKTLNARIVHKHDIEANWIKAVNFAPKQGELIIYDKDENYDYQRIKIGDGVTNVNDLSFYAGSYNDLTDKITSDENGKLLNSVLPEGYPYSTFEELVPVTEAELYGSAYYTYSNFSLLRDVSVGEKIIVIIDEVSYSGTIEAADEVTNGMASYSLFNDGELVLIPLNSPEGEEPQSFIVVFDSENASELGLLGWCSGMHFAITIQVISEKIALMDSKFIGDDIARVQSDEAVLELLMEMDVVQPMANADGAVFTDNNGKVYIL